MQHERDKASMELTKPLMDMALSAEIEQTPHGFETRKLCRLSAGFLTACRGCVASRGIGNGISARFQVGITNLILDGLTP